MNDFLSPDEREELRAYNEKRYKAQHGHCITQIDELRAEVLRLQTALHFWLPSMPVECPEEIADRIGTDAHLLAGFNAKTVESDAQSRGWITLNAGHPSDKP